MPPLQPREAPRIPHLSPARRRACIDHARLALKSRSGGSAVCSGSIARHNVGFRTDATMRKSSSPISSSWSAASRRKLCLRLPVTVSCSAAGAQPATPAQRFRDRHASDRPGHDSAVAL